jgi:hypothetical protein
MVAIRRALATSSSAAWRSVARAALMRAVSRSRRVVTCWPVGSAAGYWTSAGSVTSSKPSLPEV